MKYECNQSNQSQWVETSVATTTKLKNVFVAITLDGLINFNYIIKQCWTNLKDRIKSSENFPFFGDILLLRTYCMHIWNKEKKYISHQIAISCHSHQLPSAATAISCDLVLVLKGTGLVYFPQLYTFFLLPTTATTTPPPSAMPGSCHAPSWLHAQHHLPHCHIWPTASPTRPKY